MVRHAQFHVTMMQFRIIWWHNITRKATNVYNITMRHEHIKCCCEKNGITYSECAFVALVSQHAKLMHCILLSTVDCPVLTYFTALSHKRHNLKKKKFVNIRCVFCFSTHYSCHILIKLKFSSDFFKNPQMSNFTKNLAEPSRVIPCGGTWRN